jgi:hypothetical protein
MRTEETLALAPMEEFMAPPYDTAIDEGHLEADRIAILPAGPACQYTVGRLEFAEQGGRVLRIPQTDAKDIDLLVDGVHVFLSLDKCVRKWYRAPCYMARILSPVPHCTKNDPQYNYRMKALIGLATIMRR